MGYYFNEISKRLRRTTNFGLVVGTGGILTTVKDLPVDSYLVCDINGFVLDWVNHTINAVLGNPTLEQYIEDVYSSDLARQAESSSYGKGLIGDLEEEMKQIGASHFLSSQDIIRGSARYKISFISSNK